MSAEPETIVGGSERLFSLDWLLDPLSVETFFHRYWEAESLFISREDPDYFDALPKLDDVDELITATTSGPARSSDEGRIVKTNPEGDSSQRYIRLVSNGLPDIHDVYRAYHDGYTIIVNQVHRRSSSVGRLCRILEGVLHCPVGANLYLTPRQGQGFRAHIDTHDVFILQLHGIKEWHVSQSGDYLLPLATTENQHVELGDYQECVLKPGDVLYLPRGTPHAAVTGSSSSLHLTVGLHVYRWVDFLVEALWVVAENHAGLRAALPPGFLDRPLDVGHVLELARDFIATLSTTSSVAEDANARLGAKLLKGGKVPGASLFRSIDAVADLTGDSVIVRTPGAICSVRSSSTEAIIDFDTNYVAGPLFLEPALTFIARAQRFSVNDLPGPLSIQDKIDLVTRLATEGLLMYGPTSTEEDL